MELVQQVLLDLSVFSSKHPPDLLHCPVLLENRRVTIDKLLTSPKSGFGLALGIKSPILRWAKSHDSYRRIASESYLSDSNH